MPALDFPANPTNGQVYQNWIYSTSKGAWQAKPLTGVKTITDDVAPLNPADGDQWFSTVDGVLYIYVVDVDGGQWVESRSAIISDGYYSPNYFINGAFEINQRNFSSATDTGSYTFDRWAHMHSGGTVTKTAQAFTPGAAPVQGYEAKSFYRTVTSGQTTSAQYTILVQRIEDVRTLAGQSATISFWAKAASGTPKVAIELEQVFGTGGSPSGVAQFAFGSVTLTGGTTWTRYSVTNTVPSIAGKTVGTNDTTSSLNVNFWLSAGTDFNARASSIGLQNNTIDLWGMQIEAGSVATPFRRNANSIQGELAACQRYYWRYTQDQSFQIMGLGSNWSGGEVVFTLKLPVTMRATPSASISDIGGVYWLANNTNYSGASSFSQRTTKETWGFAATLTSPINVPLIFRPPLNSYMEASAEL